MTPDPAKWDDLRVFLEVARQGSVHAAAKRLRLDHSTVCRRIDKLESHLSVKLFDRTRRGIVVRSEAHDLLKHVEKMEFHASSLQEVMTRSGADAVQAVRIATMEGIASQYLARRLPALERFGPNITIELVSIPLTVDLSRKEADIFLSFFNPKAQGLTSMHYAEFALHLYASDSYLRQHGTPATREDLVNHTFVGYIDDLLAIHAVRWLDELITAPKMSFHSNSILAQSNAAAGGLGIVLLPTFVAAHATGLRRILPSVSVLRDVWVSVRSEQRYQSRIKAVTRFLRHVFEKDREFLLGRMEKLKKMSVIG
jgi:DNA-binding transcriptional LysR family regulator